MSDERDKPELTHERDAYGCKIRHAFHNDYAVLTDPDGREQEFQVDRAMIAQGADSATLEAVRWAKVDEAARIGQKRQDRKDEAAARKAAELVAQADLPTVVDSPLPASKPKRGNK